MPDLLPPTCHLEDAAATAEFVQLVARQRRSLEGLLRRLLPTPEDAEDVLQETLLHAYLGWGGLRHPDQCGAWLRTIAYHRAMQWQRRRYAEAERWPRLWQPGEEDGAVTAVPDRVDVTAALGRLPQADRSLLLLRHVHGLTSVEIAALMGLRATTVRSRLHRATRVFREVLNDTDRAKEVRDESGTGSADGGCRPGGRADDT